MAFEKLEFTKNWENASDFPTVETSETQVRKDMQQLHDEAKNALNAVVDKLNGKQLDGYPEGGVVKQLGSDHNTVPTSKAVRDAIVLSGGLPNSGAKGQVLRKRSATDYDCDWGDMQDVISVTGLLKGAGAGSIQAAVAGTDFVAPTDQVLQSLKKYTWRRRTSVLTVGDALTVGKGDGYDLTLSGGTRDVYSVACALSGSRTSASWATAIKVDHAAGTILYDESTKQSTPTYTTVANLGNHADSMRGNYILRAGLMWKIPADATFSTAGVEWGSDSYSVAYFNKLCPVTLQVGEWAYITADSASAFPVNGYNNGYVYEYLGSYQGEGLMLPARVTTGYYIGDGSSEAVTCKTGFRPKLFMLYQETDNGQSFLDGGNLAFYIAGAAHLRRFYGGTTYSSGSALAVTVDAAGISFPGFNDIGVRYRWAAVG